MTPVLRSSVQWRSYLSLACAMTVVGTYVGYSKLLVAVFPVFLLAWLRFAIAAAAMATWLKRPPEEAPLDAQDRRRLFVEAFFGNFVFSICMLYGVALTSALVAGVIMAAIPATVALLSRLLLRERIVPRVAAGIACGVAGVALVSVLKTGPADTDMSLGGNLLLIGAVLCEAIYVVVGKQLSGKVSARRISALVNLWGLVLVTPFGLWQAWRFDFGMVPAASWVLLVAYALAASVITVWLWMTGLKHVPASSAGVYTVLLPISAAAVGVGMLGERFSTAQVVAFVLALAGVVLATWPGAPAKAIQPA